MIQSEHIRLIPLTPDELEQYAINYRGSIKEEEHVAFVYKHILGPIQEDPDSWLYHTIWLIVDMEGYSVGEIGCKGMPDEYGIVEIGYWIEPKQRSKEYATEAVELLLDWLRMDDRVKMIHARTDLENKASHRVLEKNGFYIQDTADGWIDWVKIREKPI